ncbi:MAG: PEGA domain-containing protein [Myxococcales bacterium]
MRRLVQTLAQMVAVVLLVVSSSSALAEPPTPKDKARARELYTLGQQMFRQGDFAGAEKSFVDAYAAVPNPIVLLSIAECQVRTENFTEAVVTLSRYVSERPDAPDRAQVEEQIQKLKAKPGLVTVESTPAGATIWVDGQNSSRITPADIELPAGDHVISVEAQGYNNAEQTVTVLIGSVQRVSLSPIPQAPPAESVATTPEVQIQARATSEGKLPMWIATGVAGAGLVTGAILGGLALKEKGDFDSHPTEGKADKGERLALFADVGFGIAAAAGITAVVLYVTRDKDADKSQQSWSIKPNLAKSNLGLTGRLHF